MDVRYGWVLLFAPLTAVAGWWFGRGRMDRVSQGLRLITVTMLLVALARPLIPGSVGAQPLAIVVDQSLSLDGQLRAQVWAQAQAFAQAQAAQRPVRLIAWGGDARPATTEAPPPIDPLGSDLDGALASAAAFMPGGGQIVLISDAAITGSDPSLRAGQFAEQGIRIDSVALTATLDLRVESLRVPPALRENERFSADVVVYSAAETQTTAQLTVLGDGEPLAARTIDLLPGRNVFSIQSQAGARGFHTYQASLVAASDPVTANNTLDAWTVVGPPPRVLVVERAPDSAATLRNQLEDAGLVTEAIRPESLSTSLTRLGAYDTIVLQDVPAEALSLDQQLAIRESVRSLGHGLVTLGGSNSLSLGGYEGTPLEDVLPVSMEPPPRRERPAVALLLMIDRSASMLGVPGQDKFSLAKAAAIAATESLGPDDSIGVVTFESAAQWTVDFTPLGSGLELSRVQEQIAAIEAGGGTNIYRALELGLPALGAQTATVRHAVLFTDGKSVTESSYEALIAPLRAEGITLSTIAIGSDADQALLESLARLGAGRYHFASQPEDLPRLTLQETEIARQNPLAEGTFQVNLATPHPAIRGLTIAGVPALDGYIATTPKPEAEVLLQSPEGDAIMASWQYGLGRSIVWTSDANERWGTRWQTWAGSGPLWAQVIAATYPDPAAGPLQVQTRLEGDQALITLDAFDSAGMPVDLAAAGLRIIGPAGAEQALAARQSAPGRYEALVDAPEEGAYQVLAALEQPGLRLEATSGFARPYAAEWSALPDPAILDRLASATGGATASDLAALESALSVAPARPDRELWPLFVAVALLLWLCEVAWRRGWLAAWRWK